MSLQPDFVFQENCQKLLVEWAYSCKPCKDTLRLFRKGRLPKAKRVIERLTPNRGRVFALM
jgi:hypothetical protein